MLGHREEARRAETGFEREEGDRGEQEPAGALLVVHELDALDLGLLEVADLPEDIAKGVGTGRAVVGAARRVGDRGERLLVELSLHAHHPPAEDRVINGEERLRSGASHANRVDLDLHRRSEPCRRDRVDVPRVVHAVRDQDDDAALRLALAKTVHGARDRASDRGAVLEHPDLHVLEKILEDPVVERERALDERAAREDDEADPVARPPVDELRDGLLGDVEAVVRTKVLGSHAPRRVEGDHDVDPLGIDLDTPVPRLRARRRDDEEGERADPERREEARGETPGGEARLAEEPRSGESDPRAAGARHPGPSEEPPDDDEKEEKGERVGEAQHGRQDAAAKGGASSSRVAMTTRLARSTVARASPWSGVNSANFTRSASSRRLEIAPCVSMERRIPLRSSGFRSPSRISPVVMSRAGILKRASK